MRTFLVENSQRIFQPWTPTNEDEFEKQIIRVASKLMPSYLVANWKPLIRDRHGHGAKPDLAMISSDLESWYVVEVELARHSVSGHIAPQLETLSNGVYDSSILPSLQSAFPSQECEFLTRMVRREPGLLCIVDEYTDSVLRACRDTGFELVVLEPYHGLEGGWAVLAQKLPTELARENTPRIYALSRAHLLGNSIAMMLPRDFPASIYKILAPMELGGEERFFQVQRFQGGPCVVIPLSLVPGYASARVEVIDPSQQSARLIIGDNNSPRRNCQ